MLYHADQLQKGGHHAKGYGAVAQSDAAPYKRHEIAQPEDAPHDESRHDGKAGAAHDVAAKPLLHGVQSVGHPLLTAQRAQHGIILHALLYLHLYAAFVLSDVQCHLPETPGNQLAEDNGQWRE